SVDTQGWSAPVTLTARWTYEDGQVVNESSQQAEAGPATTEFHIAKPSGWPAGSYQIEILADGASAAGPRLAGRGPGGRGHALARGQAQRQHRGPARRARRHAGHAARPRRALRGRRRRLAARRRPARAAPAPRRGRPERGHPGAGPRGGAGDRGGPPGRDG